MSAGDDDRREYIIDEDGTLIEVVDFSKEDCGCVIRSYRDGHVDGLWLLPPPPAHFLGRAVGSRGGVRMRLYHATSAEAAISILDEGFRDGTGSYGFIGITLSGVFFSDEPATVNEGATSDDVLLTVEIPEQEIAQYGWDDAIREWCIPAEVVNRYGPPQVYEVASDGD